MLTKWKTILSNWINCYPKDTIDANQTVNLQSLLNIISHLRENFCLDESKSSILEAHTLDEFIVEKYPEFTFENGKIDSMSEEELYIVASLLLLFVCVNSKDVDLKTAMCSKLSTEDQETILKFSKCLMECSSVTYREVENAILESCGQDTASCQEPASKVTVAETPPALRSLHGEVRRLNAALEAERFDRNYLQEELARTQIKIEKLVKEKDEYKRDILELKARISCGDAAESRAEGEGDSGAQKLLRQLEDLEQRLVDTRAQLDELVYERDTYRAKVDELKLERDKWLAFGQQESTRAIQLAEELDLERRTVESLRELVTELRQHNRHNGLDASQLECDDPDVSIHSLGHNMSVCNEACANVVEVQLAEERARVTELRDQIQHLQAQFDALNQRAEEEKLTLTKILNDKESELMDLKHRVNEEIEDKHSIKTFYSNEVSQLNNEINELEQKMRADNDNYSKNLEAKMKDIQTVQEEKLTLLQSLSDETTKHENVLRERDAAIQSLTADLNSERTAKQKQRDDYDNHIMKLNEKVLNRNNELVELQNNVFSKSEMIETVNAELRREKESRELLEDNITRINAEISRLNQALGETDGSLRHTTLNFELSQQQLAEKCATVDNLTIELQRLNETFVTNVKHLEEKIIQLVKDIEVRDQLIREHEEEIDLLRKQTLSTACAIEEKDSAINIMEMQLGTEISVRNNLQGEVEQLREAHNCLMLDYNNLNDECAQLNIEVRDKNRIIEALNMHISDEKATNYQLSADRDSWKLTVDMMTENLVEFDNKVKALEKELLCYQDEIRQKNEMIQEVQDKISIEICSKSELNNLILSLNEVKDGLVAELSDKSKDILLMKDDMVKLYNEIGDKKADIEKLKLDLKQQEADKLELQIKYDKETTKLTDEIAVHQKRFEDFKTKSGNDIDEKDRQVHDLQIEIVQLKTSRANLEETLQNKVELINNLMSQVKQLETSKKESENKSNIIKELENRNKQLLDTIEEHNSRHETLSKEKDAILNRLQIITEQLSSLEADYTQELVMREKLNNELKHILETKDKKLTLLEQQLEETKQSSEQDKSENAHVIKELNEKVTTLIQDKEKLAKEISSYQTIVSINETNIKELSDELAEEKRIVKTLYSERETLISQRDKLKDQLLNKESVIEILEGEYDELNTFQINMKQLMNQEKHDRKSIEHRIENLIETKEKLSLKLMEELATKELLANKNESKDKELDLLKQKLIQEEATKGVIISDKELLTKQLREEIAAKDKLVVANENLQALNQTLTEQITKAIQEKDTFAVEKENLLATLNEEKAAKDQLENEKDSLTLQLEESKQQHDSEINSKLEEIKHLSNKLSTLKENLNENVKSFASLSNMLNSTLDKVVMQLKSQDIKNDNLRTLISSNNYRDMPAEQCNLLLEIANTLSVELTTRKVLEEALEYEKVALTEFKEQLNRKQIQLQETQAQYKSLQQSLSENQVESSKLNVSLQEQCKALSNELNDVKLQLEVKVHSLKEKLVDNEHLTDKLKKSYECQIDNLNVMSNKLTNYLKDKSAELDAVRKEKEKLLNTVEDNNKVIKTLEDEIKSQTANQEKLINDFESERLILKNMVTVTESVMEDLKVTLEKEISEHVKTCDTLQQENKTLKETIDRDKAASGLVIQEKESAFNMLFKELSEDRLVKERLEKELGTEINNLKQEIQGKNTVIEQLTQQNKEIHQTYECKIQEKDAEIQKLMDEIDNLEDKLRMSREEIVALEKRVEIMINGSDDLAYKLEVLKNKGQEELMNLQKDNVRLVNAIEDSKDVIIKLEQVAKHEIVQSKQLRDDTLREKLNLVNKCSRLEQQQAQAEKEIDEYRKEITTLQTEINTLRCEAEGSYSDFGVSPVRKRLTAEQNLMKELGFENMDLYELKQKIGHLLEVKDKMVKDNEGRELVKIYGQSFEARTQPASSTHYFGQDHRDNHKVDISPPNFTQSSDDSNKTITDLEKIIHDKNRTITTLQSDITYLKNLVADSENKLLDVAKELEVSKENCQQLSTQLKKIVLAKNEEIAEMKRQMSKMSVTENRATQIIKVSAKYQAIILKRIAEIKSNTVLKELTNFGNSENDARRGLAGNITMEDLENFLETTDRHLKRCSDKQNALQKERDRLSEVNRINESEIINMKKFLTELSLSFKTFSSVKEVYSQKLSRVVSLQRTVRREILNLDGQITDAAMCKLERGYTAVMQDLSECALNLERWVERIVARTISPEKIKQAYSSEIDRASMSSSSFLNTSMEVQLDELEKSFGKVLEDVARAAKGEGVRDAQSVTVMEVRAEYEDKLNRMKAKMKQLYQEQITIFREKQKQEIAVLERELEKAREKLAESSRSYEEHIRGLTTELWSVGEKFLMKKDEAEWLRRKRSGSLQSLQHVHSSGLLPRDDHHHHHHRSRPSDACSLRSLPVHKEDVEKKTEGHGLHMSDEEGEVFDNRWLATLDTPRRRSPAPAAAPAGAPPGARLSELRWRNSLCLPHLKSSYPVETQFAQTLQEDDIKLSSIGGKSQRKEVGITAYKKPGPPTPSKQAGRLSATDSELRESLRPEPSEAPSRKTSTPSRLRALFRSSKTDNTDGGTPRSRRLSIFRSKK